MEMGAAKIVTYKKLREIGKCFFFPSATVFSLSDYSEESPGRWGKSVAFAARAPLVLQLDQVSC